MRPRFTLRSALLLLIAVATFGVLAYWLRQGAPLPGQSIPSTAGKIAFVSDRAGSQDVWMMDGDGGNPAALTTDPADDTAPAWSRNGQEVAFISNRREGYLQVFLVEASPGARPRPLTITSQTKSSPTWGTDGRVYYLASGQLTATTPGTSDADAIFPTADLRNKLSQLFSTGGLSWASPSPDTKTIAASLGLESGEALLLQPPGTENILLLGISQGIAATWAADGTLVAAMRGGVPSPEPFVLLDDSMIQNPLYIVPSLPPAPEADANFLVRFDTSGKLLSQVVLPFLPSDVAVSPDGQTAAITVEEGPAAGVVLVPLAGGEGKPVFRQAARSPAWSPDGKTIAFASGKDVWTVPADGSAAAKNLTNGQGVSTAPVWSPARPGQ